MKRVMLVVVLSAMLFATAGIGSASARKGSSGATCSVTPALATVGVPYTVSVSGLPTGSPIYLWISNISGDLTTTYLGTTSTGSFTLTESASSIGMWSYQFTGPQKSSNTAIYATCSVSVN